MHHEKSDKKEMDRINDFLKKMNYTEDEAIENSDENENVNSSENKERCNPCNTDKSDKVENVKNIVNFVKSKNSKKSEEIKETKSEEKPVVSASPVYKESASSKLNGDFKMIATEITYDNDKFKPKYKKNSNAADLVANIPEGSVSLPYRSTVVVDCGFELSLNSGYKACVKIKDEFAKKGLIIPNSPVLFYGKERVKVIVCNVGKEIIPINHEDIFAEIYIEPVYKFNWIG